MQPLGTDIKILVMFATLAMYEDVVLDNLDALWTLQLGILWMPAGSYSQKLLVQSKMEELAGCSAASCIY